MFEYLLHCMRNKLITASQLEKYVPKFITTSQFEEILAITGEDVQSQRLQL